MPIRQFKTTIKKKKFPYWMTCGGEHIVGTTDNPRRTLTSIFKVYRDCEKEICVNLGTLRKVKNLCIAEKGDIIEYTYKNKEITKEQFTELLN